MQCNKLLAVCLMCATVAAAYAASVTREAGTEDGERTKRETFDMMGFLQHYGYLPVSENPDGGPVYHSEAIITQAVKDFQAFTGLPVTGHLDKVTIDKMMSPRCGVPDKASGLANAPSQGTVPRANSFHTLGTRWGKDTVTWRLQQQSGKLSAGQQQRALVMGLKHWSDVIPLKFRQTTGPADMDILFGRGDHGDGYHNRFNGRGGVLAHAFQPGEGIGGDTHFDEDEDWSLGTGRGTDLETVAAHEFGHALGLGHSDVPGALMAPYYSYSPSVQLHEDDVRGIQALYGPRQRTTPKPTTTTTQSTTTRETTRPTATTYPSLPPFCRVDFKVDAVANGEDGTSFLFHGYQVYKVGPWGLETGYPRYIREIFPNGPRHHISAAVSLPGTNTHYLFKGRRVWRFHNYRLDEGYPRFWLSHEEYTHFRPGAALTFTYGAGITKIFMFGWNDTFWDWDTRTEFVAPGYPLQTSKYWLGVPLNPEAATSNTDNNFYFFKGNRYFKLYNRVSVGQSKPLGRNWFGAACGASSVLEHPEEQEEAEAQQMKDWISMNDNFSSQKEATSSTDIVNLKDGQFFLDVNMAK